MSGWERRYSALGRRLDPDSRIRAAAGEEIEKIVAADGDATLGRPEIRLSGMEEDRAAAPGHDRIVVPAQRHYKVVEPIVAPEALMAAGIGEDYPPIVGP